MSVCVCLIYEMRWYKRADKRSVNSRARDGRADVISDSVLRCKRFA